VAAESTDHDVKVQAGGDQLQARSEQKVAEMADNPDLHRDAVEDAEDAAHRAEHRGQLTPRAGRAAPPGGAWLVQRPYWRVRGGTG